MKTSLFRFLLVLTLCACNESPTTPEDIITIEKSLQLANPQIVVAVGTKGDILVRIPRTKQLQTIYAKKKSSTFLSIKNPANYAQPNTCLVNIIPDSGCPYRLFCDNASYIHQNKLYAIQLCK